MVDEKDIANIIEQISRLEKSFDEVKSRYDNQKDKIRFSGDCIELKAIEGGTIDIEYQNEEGHTFCFGADRIFTSIYTMPEYKKHIWIGFAVDGKEVVETSMVVPVEGYQPCEKCDPNNQGKLYASTWLEGDYPVCSIIFRSKRDE